MSEVTLSFVLLKTHLVQPIGTFQALTLLFTADQLCAYRRAASTDSRGTNVSVLIYVKQRNKSSMPLPSLSPFHSCTSHFILIIKSHLKQHGNDIAITELPLLLSGQSAGKAQLINQRPLQGMHI